MADYTPQTWVDDDGTDTVGTVVTKARMDTIEAGVKDAAQDAHARGTYAARPAAATANKNWFYYAYDVGVLYRSTGSAWERVASDAALGEMLDFIGHMAALPAGTLLADGSAISRTTYADLFALVTVSVTGNTTTNSFGISNLAGNTGFIKAGMYLSGPGIPAGAVVNTPPPNGTVPPNLTFTAAGTGATSNNTGATYVFSWFPLGDGSTTFNLPDTRGRASFGGSNPGAGGTLTQRNPGATGGAETVTLAVGEMPAHAHPGSTASSSSSASSSGSSGGPSSTAAPVATVSGFNPGWYNGNAAIASNAVAAGAGIASHTHSISVSTSVTTTTSVTVASQGGGGAHANMPPWVGVAKVVKVY